MNFCEHCGNRLKPNALFCNNCGALLAIDAEAQPVGNSHPSPNQPGTTNGNSHSFIRNKKFIRIAAIVIAVIILFYFIPKKMNEPEYTQFAIEHLAGLEADFYHYREYVNESGIDIDKHDYSVAEGKALVKPTKELQKTINQRYKALNKIKPPNLYKRDHEYVLNNFSSLEKSIAAVVSFLETGDRSYEDVSTHHRQMADSYIENSVFTSDDILQEMLDEKYRQLMGW